MRQRNRILLPILTIISLLALNNCKKENTPALTTQNSNSANSNTVVTTSNYVTGYFGYDAITLTNNPSYFTNLTQENNGNNGGNYGTVSGDHNLDGHPDNGQYADDDVSMLVTGCSWSTADAQGMLVNTGTIELRKEIFRIYVTPFLSNQYYGMLQPGDYNYAYHNNAKNGAYITIRDSHGMLWTSSGDQTGSTFRITARGNNMQTYANVTGNFTCKLYDDNGNVKTFTATSFNANCGL